MARGFAETFYLVFYLMVAFKQFYGKVSWREVAGKCRCGFEHIHNLAYCRFEVGTEVHMHMAHSGVAVLVNIYNGIEKVGKPFAGPCDHWYHRHANHASELGIV